MRQGETSHHANIAWRHAADADSILLATPLGQGVAELTRDAGGAHLVTGEGESSAPDWEALSERVFGVPLPLANLPRWVVGGAPATTRDRQGRPEAARADGWDIRYLDYESPEAAALPVLMEFRRADMELRLKVDQWELE